MPDRTPAARIHETIKGLTLSLIDDRGVWGAKRHPLPGHKHDYQNQSAAGFESYPKVWH